MGISISGPSTQIPTNVVEIGNEISQNAINAIAAANLPSTGNPFTTASAAYNTAAALVVNKQNTPTVSWGQPYPIPTNYALGLLNGGWVPLAPSGAVVGEDTGAAYPRSASYNFDFTDDTGNYVSLNGSADVGLDNVTSYYSAGDYNGDIQSASASTNYAGTGPNYASNWDNSINYAQYYDSSWNVWYRYVYLDGSGGFYTADNQNNPPS